MGTVTGAEAALRAAEKAGVSVVFANPGTTEMWFCAALDSTPGIRPILGLHETVCTGACDGYARMTRKPAISLLHLGPGLCNGMANLHNARRAMSPVLVLIGDMTTWLRDKDPLLNMDIESVARTVSAKVIKVPSLDQIVTAMQDALRACSSLPRLPKMEADAGFRSRIATLVVPHDYSWAEIQSDEDLPLDKLQVNGKLDGISSTQQPDDPGLRQFVKDCAAALKREGKKAAIYISGQAMLDEASGAFSNIGKVAAATGAQLLCETTFARMDRGAGRPVPMRLPYFPFEGRDELAKYDTVVLVDAKAPVAMFGYKGGPSDLVSQPDDKVWTFDEGLTDVPRAMALLAAELGADRIQPCVNCGGVFAAAKRPALPKGRLTPTALCTVVAAVQPEHAIVVDEALTSGKDYYNASQGCPPFTHLCLTGGAIGSGPPLAVGAAVACPDRRVINLQADGSGMYSLQALWTQAREKLDVLTVICDNSQYAILKVEVSRQELPLGMKGAATTALTNLNQPEIDWVHLAQGMGVPASKAATVAELVEQMQAALQRKGPYLIQAQLR